MVFFPRSFSPLWRWVFSHVFWECRRHRFLAKSEALVNQNWELNRHFFAKIIKIIHKLMNWNLRISLPVFKVQVLGDPQGPGSTLWGIEALQKNLGLVSVCSTSHSTIWCGKPGKPNHSFIPRIYQKWVVWNNDPKIEGFRQGLPHLSTNNSCFTHSIEIVAFEG